MTGDIFLLLCILGSAVLLFVTGWLRVDLVALLVLISLALTGLATPADALAGFSNPAVVTVWAVFILSGGLARTGVAGMLGRQILRVAGSGELRLILVIMLTAGLLSAFMNNVGVAALLLPVVMDIARRTDCAPSKLLMPLSFGCLLGGLTTLVGTPPNILVTGTLRAYGLEPFHLFDFTPVGLAIMVAGITFMALLGRHLLPSRHPAKETTLHAGIACHDPNALREHLFIVHVPDRTLMQGRTLGESRLGAGLGLNVIALLRGGKTLLAPNAATVLHGGDRLLVEGNPEQLSELHGRRFLIQEADHFPVEALVSGDIGVADVTFTRSSGLPGRTLRNADFRKRFGVNVVGILREDRLMRTGLGDMPLRDEDVLLIEGPRWKIEELKDHSDFKVSKTEAARIARLQERLMLLRVPADSSLVGKTLSGSRLGEALELSVIGIFRDGKTFVPGADETFQAQDRLLVEGRQEELKVLQALQDLEIEAGRPVQVTDLESDTIGFTEAILSPHTSVAGKSLRDLHFREKYGLSVVGLCRQGQTLMADFRDQPLRFGDGLLLYGPWEKIKMLGSESDFLVLSAHAEEPPRLNKAPLAVLAMAVFVVPVILGWIPVYLGAVTGAGVAILVGCLTMEEAYRAISWRAVFLIAGMLPLGAAMERTGAAPLAARHVLGFIGDLGPLGVMAGLFIVTALCAQIMPTSAVAILIAPIAMDTALDLNLSPHALMMTVAMSASASFLSPVAHPANVLVMGPAGYRFSDYTKVGVPLTALCLLVVVFVLPVFWPLTP